MTKSNGNRQKEFKPVSVKYSKIENGQFNDEVVVTLASSTGAINMLLHRSFLDEPKQAVIATIIDIDQEADKYLIGLPNETFTTGSKVWFPKSVVLV